MSVLGLFTGETTMLVGVEDDPEGGIRCFLGHRSRGLYCVIDEPDAVRRVRDAWEGRMGHVTMKVPPAEFIYDEADDLTPASRDSQETT